MGTYLYKAIPDTRLTVKKYADAKFEYLAYCLKVKEMDDEECNYAALQEPLYRVETGNYEYRHAKNKYDEKCYCVIFTFFQINSSVQTSSTSSICKIAFGRFGQNGTTRQQTRPVTRRLFI